MTYLQKKMFIDLAAKYEPRLLAFLQKGNDEEIILENEAQAQALEEFAKTIVARVGEDYPDDEGKDMDVNQDAIKVSFLTSNIVHKFRENHPN